MPAKPNPGKDFEAEVIASLPPESIGGRAVHRHKLADMPFAPTRPGRSNFRDGMRFTPKHPYDLEVSAPVAGTEKMRGRVVPQVVFKLELKRTAGAIAKRGSNAGRLHATLGFGEVKRHQVAGMLKAARAGQVAGILWLVELVNVEAACHFIHIFDWRDYIAECAGEIFPESFNDEKWRDYLDLAKPKSMPLATAAARGTEVAEDVGRGRERRYWMMREFLIHFGASVEPTPKRKVKRQQAVKLFEEPEPQQEIEF